jgi:hypothetical protein
MKNILEELYLGNIAPCDWAIPNSDKYVEFVKNTEHLEAQLLENFERGETYKALKENLLAAHELEKMQCFINGYKLGARFMLEVGNFD